MNKSITVSFLNREPMHLRPHPMSFYASADSETWLKFIKGHVENAEVSSEQADLIQRFMLLNQTDALTDGAHFYTLGDNSLAYCDPIKAKYGFSLGNGWVETDPNQFRRDSDPGETWIEGNLVANVIRFQGKLNGGLGDSAVYAVQQIAEHYAATHDQPGVFLAIEKVESALRGSAVWKAREASVEWLAADGYTQDLYGGAILMTTIGGKGTPFVTYDMTICEYLDGSIIPMHGSVKMTPVKTIDEAKTVLLAYWKDLPDSQKLAWVPPKYVA